MMQIKTVPSVEALYIHIPFCMKKCNYCDFLSFPHNHDTEESMELYISALINEMKLVKNQFSISAKTIFIGGGTPSCLPEHLLQILLEAIYRYFVTDALQEYTIELNPGTITWEKLQLMRNYGINRLSIGVQSDTVEQLKLLGRIHSFSEAQETVQMARRLGFTNINLDFMYGIPGQTLDMWRDTLQAALELNPEHLSLYQLKIEENTVFAHWMQDGKIQEFDDEMALDMYRLAQSILTANGYGQYEISNYAKPGYESMHNQVYWRTENYLGLGLGACSWVRPLRWNNSFEMVSYLEGLQQDVLLKQDEEQLSQREQMKETVFMALRMNQGLSKELFSKRFGVPIEAVFAVQIAECEAHGWIVEDAYSYKLTEEGRVLGNLVFLEFVDTAVTEEFGDE